MFLEIIFLKLLDSNGICCEFAGWTGEFYKVTERVTDRVTDRVTEKEQEILALLLENAGYTMPQLAEKLKTAENSGNAFKIFERKISDRACGFRQKGLLENKLKKLDKNFKNLILKTFVLQILSQFATIKW